MKVDFDLPYIETMSKSPKCLLTWGRARLDKKALSWGVTLKYVSSFAQALFSLLFLFNINAYSADLPDSFFDAGYAAASSAWLGVNEENEEGINSISDGVIYRNAYSIAIDQLFAQGKWVAHKILNHDIYTDHITPKLIDFIQMAQAPVVTKELCVGCTIFISKGGDIQQTLILGMGRGFVAVMHRVSPKDFNRNQASIDLAQEFLQDARAQIKVGSVYKNAVLEFDGDVHFLQNVDGLKATWDDFIFPQAEKDKIRESIDGFINEYNEEAWRKFGLPLSRGILLYGPPGTGKSFVAKVIASNILNKRYKNQVSYIFVSARHVKYASVVRSIYQVARDLSPSVVLIEDIDLIAGTDRSDRADVKNELMQQLSGLETLKGVLTIGTTNVAERIDPALKRSRRLGFQFEIGLPKHDERVQLLQIYFSSVTVDSIDFSIWADKLEGSTGADIKELCEIAIEKAINNKSFLPGTPKVRVLEAHLLAAYNEKSQDKIHSLRIGGR